MTDSSLLTNLLDEATTSAFWNVVLGKPLMIALTVIIALVVRWVAARLIDRIVRSATDRHDDRVRQSPGRAGRVLQSAGLSTQRHVQRTRTMGSIMRSVVSIVIGTVALITIMAILDIPVAPLLASAGVGGVALGFGAQSLVKDFLSGIFMIVEDQYGVGDVIDTGSATGTVEEVSLRVTRLRDANGVLWYVRNGEILRIGNQSQGWSTATVELPVANAKDVEQVLGVVRDVVAGIDASPEFAEKLLEPPQVMGVESIGAGSVTVRVVAKCLPAQQYAIARAINERVRIAFADAGIDEPAPPGFPGAAGGLTG